jgi:Sulfatase
MKFNRKLWLGLFAVAAAAIVASAPATAQQQQQKPNILFIMGDDIGWMQPSIYHQGLMVGETPNIDRIGQEGAKFSDYYAEQSCTAGRNAFFTGMNPVIRPGTLKKEIFASLDWLPTFVNIAGGAKGDELKKRIEAGQYPGIVRTTLDGVDQTEYLSGRSEKSARDTFFYYSSAHPSAVRYKNWKMYFAIAPENATGFLLPGVQTQFAAGVVNLKRDPFETSWGTEKKANFWFSGALAGPVTGYIYDWNLLPMGQALWLKELETYKQFPPLQDPASYNLDQVMEQLKKAPVHASQ